MINLFEEKNENIKYQILDDKVVFDIDAKEKLHLKINWTSVDFLFVVINVHNCETVRIIEVGEPKNVKIEYNLDEDSKLELSTATFYNADYSSYIVNLKRNAIFKGALADFSYGKKKMNFACNLNEDGAQATWNLASLATKNDEKIFNISFYHYAPHTYARMENYGVCENESQLSFLGTSNIERGAKHSATHQAAKIMVFDPKCKAKASPSLCIDENDVEASHAAVVGQINEEHIFYLMTRGIEEENAKKLITLGYLNPILNFFDEEDVLNEIKENIEKRM